MSDLPGPDGPSFVQPRQVLMNSRLGTASSTDNETGEVTPLVSMEFWTPVGYFCFYMQPDEFDAWQASGGQVAQEARDLGARLSAERADVGSGSPEGPSRPPDRQGSGAEDGSGAAS